MPANLTEPFRLMRWVGAAQVSNLPVVARALAVSLEDLFGASDRTPGKRGPAPKWQKQIEAIALLPRAKQQFVSQMLDTVLAQAQR
jgi:hypothetical protein